MDGKHNIVFIMLDSLRRDHLGCYGNTVVRTPNLDRFAGENLVYDDARIGSFPTAPKKVRYGPPSIKRFVYSATSRAW